MGVSKVEPVVLDRGAETRGVWNDISPSNNLTASPPII